MASTDTDFFIKSALPAPQGAALLADDTSLALPPEGEMCGARGLSADRSSRVQRQVQLTLTRKSARKPPNGILQSQDPTSTSGDGRGFHYVAQDLGHESEWKQRWDTVRKSQKVSTCRAKGSLVSSPDLSVHAIPGHRMLYSETTHQGSYTLPTHNLVASRTSQLGRTWASGTSKHHYSVHETSRSGLGSMRETFRSGVGSMHETYRGAPGSMREIYRGGTGSMHETYRGGTGSMRETYWSRAGSMREANRGGVGWRQQRSDAGKPQPDSLAFLGTLHKDIGAQINNQGSYAASLVSMEVDGLMGQTGLTQDIIHSEVQQLPGENLIGQNHEGPGMELMLERAVKLLGKETPSVQVSAINYIQHKCFINPEARKKVLILQGIPRLIQLWHSDNEQLHKAAAATLRNIVFENNDNKMEVKDKGGIESLLSVLKSTRDTETREQLTGLLWNLSSHDLLKDYLCREALKILTDTVIVPFSGIAEGENPKDDLLTDPDTFYNATGCLRNLSSAGPETRGAMRNYIPVIDGLVHYVQGTIADHKPDDKSTENCICILHNLSYQMEHLTSVHQSLQNLAPRSKALGCFGSRSRDMAQRSEKHRALLEEKRSPHGVEWLGSPIIVRMYLSLIARSSRKYTLEAATGALQNITAGNGKLPFTMVYTIVQKENGLQQVKRMLHEGEPDVKRAAVSLLRNISRYSEVHGEIVQQVLPELIALLPSSDSSADLPSEVAVTVCQILINLSRSEGFNVRAIINQGGLGKIISMSTKENGFGPTRTGQAASVLLHAMWKHKELHSAYRKAGYRKADFINSKTVKALNSVEN